MVSIISASVPKSQPIKSFKDLLAWQPGLDEYNVSHIPFHPRPEPLTRKRGHVGVQKDTEKDGSPTTRQLDLRDCKVVVCHDMAGGYQEDASPQGNDYSTIYSIQYWNHVDTFIYFSHSRVTIPPPVWTNAAHKNGVRCLGTIITEWMASVMETDEMVSGPDQALADEDGNDTVDRRWFSRTYADKLVDLAVYYKFDGWFINIESILRGGAKQANQTIAFLAYLRAQIHARIPGGELHWYDSVISSTGELAWQDRLSPKNYRFFEQSDAIFTNYTWKEPAVGESVALAGPRNRDVYTGIDVWGRNTFGGGGYNSYKALEVIQREGTSCAFFAPAWTYESLGKEYFMTNDRFFWTGYNGAGIHAESLPLSSFYEATSRLLSGELGKKPDAKDKEIQDDNKAFLPVSAYIPARPSGTSKWFYSNFDRGFGKSFWVNGKVAYLAEPNSTTIRWILSPEEPYNGGTSVMIQEFIPVEKTPTLPPVLIPPPPPGASQSSEKGVSLVKNELLLKSKTVLVPLFDIQISLHNAQNSTVELVFRTYGENVRVGIHLGMLAAEIDKESSLSRVARKVSKQEFSQLLHPEVRAQGLTLGDGTDLSLSNVDSSVDCALARESVVGLVTLDDPETSKNLEPVFAMVHSPTSTSNPYSIEPLLDGWQRLTLHLSSLFDLNPGPSVAGKENIDLSSISLSQIGVTVNYEEQLSSFGRTENGKEDSRLLLNIGSLAVVPTCDAHSQGSYVLGLKADKSLLVLLEQQQSEMMPRASLSSTLTWNVGFPVVEGGSALRETYSATGEHISTFEYSHYYVYVSLEKTKDSTDIEPVFVGMAFTNRYQISNFEIALDNTPPTEPATAGKLVPFETLKQNGLEVWAWVQGVRRDGRVDAKQDWSKARLL
ncbi:hypothetical protein BGZ80_009416 [Entomortierella chlamydospora]|uniref:Cytosolic endo-beta-N-acetylglucosaminidase TIM barrel domain-containing protein n=1 Tax=Entomortierella chlamydospora TaxID=101097 RepID=A0A9P6MX35_9FUNG|nr:hypothetical protein BGZ79_009551 [Entomortierella chlamydospora]KAG0016126.1 hypothetical protein BGZ80_009416 [Entomortierella chlamydospora]